MSTFIANSSHARSAPKESESFFAGLKVNRPVFTHPAIHQAIYPCTWLASFFLSLQFTPDLLQIAENGREHLVRLDSTVPIPCYSQESVGPQCDGVPVALSVSNPGRMEAFPNSVALSLLTNVPSFCQHRTTPRWWRDGRGVVHLPTAVKASPLQQQC